MTALQATVALAVFAPGVLAPHTGIDAWALSAFSTAVFGVGAATAVWGGVLADRLGAIRVAQFCALAVAAGMAVAGQGSAEGTLILAGILLGFAFGPETPASSALLARLVTERNRPLVFSIRQTGNQLGAMLGSLLLPSVALAWGAGTGYGAVAVVALAVASAFALLRRHYDGEASGAVAKALSLRSAWRLARGHPGLRQLAIVALPYSAMQMTLNTYFVLFAVRELGLSLTMAGLVLATAQAGGLVGRILWGAVASHGVRPRRIVALLGLGMALAATATALAGPRLPMPLLAGLALLFGLTASGWNGVFLAEVARLAPPGRGGEATGAVLVASYVGLVAGPGIVSAVALVGGLAASYAAIAVFCAAAGLMLMVDPAAVPSEAPHG